jgi:hypothetical protein
MLLFRFRGKLGISTWLRETGLCDGDVAFGHPFGAVSTGHCGAFSWLLRLLERAFTVGAKTDARSSGFAAIRPRTPVEGSQK